MFPSEKGIECLAASTHLLPVAIFTLQHVAVHHAMRSSQADSDVVDLQIAGADQDPICA